MARQIRTAKDANGNVIYLGCSVICTTAYHAITWRVGDIVSKGRGGIWVHRMGRIEALKLGEQLVKYGNTKIEGED